jgi:hypothetical protein
MSKNTEKVRNAIENSLQGLAFWMGYRNTTCHEYVFTEYSLVDEFSSLLKSLLGREYIIKREEKYSNHFPEIKKGDRMDLFITDKDAKKKYAVIEVKRWRVKDRTTKKGDKEKQYNDDEIEKDIIILAKLKRNNDIPCFFILISERARPTEYVGENGNAVKKEFKIEGYDDLEYSVIRVLKASASFKEKENAYYCCLVEILKKPGGRRRSNNEIHLKP